MKKIHKKATIALVLLLLVFIGLLVSGIEALNKKLIGDFALGSLITWLGLIVLTLSILIGFNQSLQSNSKVILLIKNTLKVLLFLGFTWGIVSYALAGNWSFIFKQQAAFVGSTKAAEWFWNYTYTIILFPLFIMLIIYLIKFFKK